MKLNIDLKTLKKMQSYLMSSQIATMLDAIVDYAEYGTEFDFQNDKMNMIWEDLKPDLDRSKNSYSKWLKERMDEEHKRIEDKRKAKKSSTKEYNCDWPL